jgi:iron-sulfur cluster assembly accessory protein
MVKKQETDKASNKAILTITEAAAKKIKELAKEENKETYGLKVFVFPGGCSGFQYGMDFEEKAGKEDIELIQHGVKIFLPKECTDMIKGSKIDFINNKEISGFKIDNPNTSECGCGSKGKKKEEEGCCGEGSCNC